MKKNSSDVSILSVPIIKASQCDSKRTAPARRAVA